MAIDYFLYIEDADTSLSVTELSARVRDNFALRPAVGSSIFFAKLWAFVRGAEVGCSILLGDGLTLSVFRMDDPYRTPCFASTAPEVGMGFRIDKFDLYETGINTMLQVVGWILGTMDRNIKLGDAFDEDIDNLLELKSGQLLFLDHDFWTLDRKERVSSARSNARSSHIE